MGLVTGSPGGSGPLTGTKMASFPARVWAGYFTQVSEASHLSIRDLVLTC